ncbi:MAG TPA: pilus assembly protein PilP [Pseudobdellovibrionaceae bacterium]|nr:pilus assembly protein PilP [Pseudobdellovibrionaceae bacterium]
MMSRYRWVPVYLLTAGLGLGLAYTVSSSLMGRAVSQSPPPPSDGSLPPEFLNEIEGGTPAAPPTESPPPPAASTPPPPIENLPEEVQQPVNPPAPTQSAPPISPTPPEAPKTVGPPGGIDGYVYDPTGRRDPFRPYRMIRSGRAATGPIIEPLQTYDIDQLSVAGILWEVRAPRALVKDSDGNLHTVVKNTKIGRNNGYVAAIREGEVIVIETLEEDGKSYKRTKVLEFKK